MDFIIEPIRASVHRDGDDLLSAGLGLSGLRGAPIAFADPAAPTPAELRRRAIQVAWNGIADLGPLGGYGEVYAGVPAVPGREYQAFARVAGARSPHRVLAQIPDNFDANKRCLIVTASSGSRGIYGGIAVAPAWGLPNGCAVAHTDKGTGPGYFDCADGSGVALDGTRARAGDAELEFVPDLHSPASGIAIKHAHSHDNPEGDWGRHLLQAAQFGLAMLDRAFPQLAPFTSANTRIVAVGLSNAGTAVLQAAGLDEHDMLAGVVAIEPNVYAPAGAGARALYDYASEAAIWAPCALSSGRFNANSLAWLPGNNIATWSARAQTLRETGLLQPAETQAPTKHALERLLARGWTDAALATAVTTTAFDMWRALAITYSSAYCRTGLDAMPGGFHFALLDAQRRPRSASAAERAAWWSDAAGIAPGNGVGIVDALDDGGADAAFRGIAELAALWTGDNANARQLHASIEATQVCMPRAELPIFVVHGADDGLIPPAFSSTPYAHWLHANGRRPTHWCLPHVQHFDAFLGLPGFGERYVPMLPYAYAAIARMVAHVTTGTSLSGLRTPTPIPRGAGRLERAHLDLSGIA